METMKMNKFWKHSKIISIFLDENFAYLLLFATFCYLYSFLEDSQWFEFLYAYEKIAGHGSIPSIHIIGTFFFSVVCYWLYSGFYLLLEHDIFLKYLVSPYKIQKSKYNPWDRVKMASKVVLFNQVTGNIPFGVILWSWDRWRGLRILESLPPVTEVVYHILLSALIVEPVFYYTHRFLHKSFFYRTIHKYHHEFKTPIGLAAIYAHPLEHVMSNLLSFFVPLFIFRFHLITYWIWLNLATINTISNHSGYAFPGFRSTKMHDFHHFSFDSCFGSIGILDELHGTNKSFKTFISSNKRGQKISLRDDG